MATNITTPSEDVVYFARRSELRLTKRPRYPIRNQITGANTGEQTPSEALGFRDGALRIPREGRITMQDTLNGGEWEIDAQELHQWLRKHRLYGDKEEGFWVYEEPAPPVSADEMRALQHAALNLDEEGLEEIISIESGGWQREAVLQTAQESLAGIRQMKAEAEQAKKPGPKPKAE